MAEFDFSALSAHERYNLIIGLVTPRPIALVTTLDAAGRVNAAPFSAFNYAGADPVLVTLGVTNRPDVRDRHSGLPAPKDTAQNIRVRGEFVVNVVNEDIAAAMNICAIDFPPGVDELAEAGLTTLPSLKIEVPRIAEAAASMECREVTTLEVGRSRIIVGEVLYAHVNDKFVDFAGPYIKADELRSVGRMNGKGNYTKTRGSFFKMSRISYKDWQRQKDGDAAD